MLGYEPSEIESELQRIIINMRMKAALQQRIILKVHPIFKDEGSELAPYVTKELVQSDSFTILITAIQSPIQKP
jgi:hypothetical protein